MSKTIVNVTLEDIESADFMEVERHNATTDRKIKLVRNGTRTFSFNNYKNEDVAFYEEEILELIENKAWSVHLISIPMEEDLINKPSHYHSGGIDVFAFAEAQCTTEELRGFYKINIFKYLARAEKKNGLEDYEKAERYLKELMKLVRKN